MELRNGSITMMLQPIRMAWIWHSMGWPASSRRMCLVWTGHADYKSMKPYVDVADSIRAQEMQKFNTDDIKI